MRYVGYEPEIGFQFELIRDIRKYELDEYKFSSNEEKYEIATLLNKLHYNDFNNVNWVSLVDISFDKINSSTVTRLLRYEKTLVKLGAISHVEILLKKDSNVINLMDASSGELSFITSLMFISTTITNNSVILIDEPENSLHPKWQREYITKIMDVFYYHQPTVICATHSPIIVSGAESSEDSKLNVYKSDRNGIKALAIESGNLEQMLWDMFGVATPENRFFSKLIMSKMNALAEDRLSLVEINNFLMNLKAEVYDKKQKNIVSAAIALANKIEERK